MPGSNEIGRLAVRGSAPVGYYKDPIGSAAVFPVIDGDVYAIPGDLAAVELDGSVRLIGRGSQCINTGGEKVYPEEVEEVLKLCAGVQDAAVVGLPDERYGQVVTAIVVSGSGADISDEVLMTHAAPVPCRLQSSEEHLAGIFLRPGRNRQIELQIPGRPCHEKNRSEIGDF